MLASLSRQLTFVADITTAGCFVTIDTQEQDCRSRIKCSETDTADSLRYIGRHDNGSMHGWMDGKHLCWF